MKPQILLKYTPGKIIKGYTNNILSVDLSANSAKVEPVSKEWKRDFQGGLGYAIKILYDRTMAETDPLGEDNLLIVAAGPMTGEYRWPGGTKAIIAGLSPITGGLGESVVAGRTGEKLKFAGFDTLYVAGKAKDPSILIVDGREGQVLLASDPDDTEETKAQVLGKKIVTKYGDQDTAALTIGIAGRNLIPIATIEAINEQNDKLIVRQAGRTGLGAVMGSKNIIAIAIIGPEKKSEVANPKDLEDAGKKMRETIIANDKNQMNLVKKGLTGLVDAMNEVGALPINNFSKSKKIDVQEISAAGFIDKVFEEVQPCSPECNLACGKISEVKLPNGKKVEVDGPDYVSIAMLGSNLGIFDANWIAEAKYMCDCYGLDVTSTGGILAFAMECFVLKYLELDDTGGIDLKFGNIEGPRKLIPQIANLIGFGKICAKGIRSVIEFTLNKEENQDKSDTIQGMAMHVKGLEMSPFRPGSSISQQLAYATSPIGGHQSDSWLIAIEAARKEVPTVDSKIETVVFYQNLRTWMDLAGFCEYYWLYVKAPGANNARNLPTLNLFFQAMNDVTGLDWKLGQYLQVGGRVFNLADLINARRGFGKSNDKLPARAMGDSKPADFEKILDKYYEIRGWNKEGTALPATQKNLGLSNQ